MADIDTNTRERVRELVRHVLATVPTEGEEQLADPAPEHIVVNSLRDKAAKEWDRDESAKNLITEDDLRGLESGARLRISASAKFTSLADDIVRDRHIELIRKQERQAATTIRSIALGADHGGFRVKEALKEFLSGQGINIRDFGTDSEDAVDYPDLAHLVGQAVGAGRSDIGIIVDGAGIGSAMAANKVPGVDAAACYSPVLAKNAREHNGANVLTLGAGQNSVEELKAIVTAFMNADISEDRHKKRVAKIDSIDRSYRS